MKTIGVLGGMSSTATAEYYRLLNAAVHSELGGHASAELLLYNVDFAIVEGCIRTERWEAAGAYLAERARRLQRGGAAFVLIATNTMHRVFDDVQAAIDIPLIHIVDVTADAARAAGISRVGLLGTAPVMQADFYRERFAAHGIDVTVPPIADRALVHRIIFEELAHGRLLDDSRREYVRIIDRLAAGGAQAVVLGCTEISLLVSGSDVPRVPLLDTTALHVRRAVELSLGRLPVPQPGAAGSQPGPLRNGPAAQA